MKRTVYLEGEGRLTLGQGEFLGAGGQADVYKYNHLAIKVFHDKSEVPCRAKIDILQRIQSDRVLFPKRLVWDKSRANLLGYAMDFVADAEPIVKYFSPAFKTRHGVDDTVLLKLLDQLSDTLRTIHAAGCLVVDLNEMNLLVRNDRSGVYVIDADSFQAGTFPATAISDTIRDPKVRDDRFSTESDWYAFAVIAFQLLTGLHPYKGGHSNYKPSQWRQRMADGISALDPKATMPPACLPPSRLPPDLLAWFDAMFSHRLREPPPNLRGAAIKPSVMVNTSPRDGTFEHTVLHSYPSAILHVHSLDTDIVVQTRDGLYRNDRSIADDLCQDRVWLDRASDGTWIVLALEGSTLCIQTLAGAVLGTWKIDGACWQNGLVVLRDGSVQRVAFAKTSRGVTVLFDVLARVPAASARMFDGCVWHQPLGRAWLTLLLGGKQTVAKPLPELDGWRVLDARLEGNLCGIHAERKGVYRRFLLHYGDNFMTYTLRSEDGPFKPVNFTCLPGGVAAYQNLAGGFELMRDPNQPHRFEPPPIGEDAILFQNNGRVCYAREKQIVRLQMR